MEGETGSSSQQGSASASIPPVPGILPSAASAPSIVTPSTGGGGGATTAIGVPASNAVSAQQNPPQQQQSGVGSGREPSVVVPPPIGVQQQQPNTASSSGGHQMHPNMVPSSPGQPRPGVTSNRARQQHASPYTHFSSLSSSAAMHQQQRGGVPMQGGTGPQQRPPALGNPYGHNMQQHPRASMIGQPQGTSHPSMVPSGQTDQLSNIQSPYTPHQSRQKQGSIPSTPFQHSASSGQTLPGMQTTGTVGSPALGSQIRPSGVFGHGQQRPGQGQLRSQSPSQHQSLSSQKMHVQNLPRIPSMGSMNSQLSGISQGGQSGAASCALSHQQQWIPTQAKPMHPSSMPLTSPSYQSHLKQQGPPQRSQHTQSQQQSLPLTPQQQPHQLQEQHSQQYQQQRVPQPLHNVQQQQQLPRTPGVTIQKPPTSTGAQLSIPAGSNDQTTETSGRILGKRSVRELVSQIDPSEKLDSEVEDILVEIAEDFVDKVTNFACCLAKHRKSETLEPKDILLHLERNWNMTIPGFAGDEYRIYKRPSVNENHKQRLSVIRKSVATSQTGTETGNTKESTGQVIGNANSKVSTTKGLREVPGAQENS